MTLSTFISDHAVFAVGKPIRVFGKGKGKVTVLFDGEEKSAVSNEENWCVTLSARPYGGPYTMEIDLDGEKQTLTDIMIGDVYLLAGQSNTQFHVGEGNTPAEEYVSNPMLRMHTVDMMQLDWQYFQDSMGWCPCRDSEVGHWSALAFLIGRSITRRKGVAVGFVVCHQGASVIESWLPKGDSDEFVIAEKHPDHTDEMFGAWNGDGFLYETMFCDIPPFVFNQVIWYQGESDTTVAEANVYDRMVAKFFGVVRRDLMDENLPFILVEIADFDDRRDEGWTSLQEAQRRVPSICHGVTVVRSSDVCESAMIHPVTKVKLAERIADLL